MTLPLASALLFGLATFGALTMLVELACLFILRHRRLPDPPRWPSFSILKPLCGLDDELKENLESHLALDYPGEYEVLLGVRSEKDAAYPLARDFAAAHPDKVRLCVQQGEPGHNPKVNQLITLTRAAKHELIALTDSNVRVHPEYLKEHARVLADPRLGLSSHVFIGVGEKKLGAVLDNLTLASYCATSIAAGSVAMRLDQIVGKSLGLRREVLAQVGGWHEVKDLLAEDQQLGVALRRMGLRTALCPTPVQNVQINQPLSHFWGRHTRWAMIRFRVLIPGVLLEPIMNSSVLALAGALVAWRHPGAWAFAAGMAFFSIVYAQTVAVIARGYGFSWRHLLLVPLRDVLFFLTWVRGATMRWVTWRGNRLHVLARTRLAEPTALERVRNIQKHRTP
ncbi:MAG: glycosyltransferase [Myxococcota bacterium]